MEGCNRNWRLTAGGLMAALLCLPLLSCSDGDAPGHDITEEVRDNICFSVSSGDVAWTRSDAGETPDEHPSDCFVLRTEGLDDTLCVCTVVSDGICPSRDYSGKVVTRGAPVTEGNFHGAFHVLAYRTTGGVLADQFFMDEDATNGGSDTWNTAKTYYWPGVEHSLKFYAWAPADAFTSVPTTSASTTLGYTVPSDVTNQKDLVVAVTGDINGDNNSAVPLTFKHICTAVSIKVGSQMQPGVIKSVALAGVKYKGTYDMQSGAWTLDDSTEAFSQVLNLSTTGAETDGTDVTTVEGTFMMLPQVLSTNAKMIVEFESRVTGETYQLEASIAGGEWKMGIPTVYKLSITPELDIEVPTGKQDAHYITFPVTIHVKRYTGDWKLTSNRQSDVFFTKTKTSLQEQGYWIDNDKGNATVTGTGVGDFTYQVYVTENVTDAARDIEFRLKPVAAAGTAVNSVTATVQQLCPSWNSAGVGYERIEEDGGGSYPFGFSWNRVATFSYTGPILYGNFYNRANDLKGSGNAGYYSVTRNSSSNTTTAVIDYKNAFSLGKSTNDGLANTKELFSSPNKKGFQDAINLETTVGSIEYSYGIFGTYRFSLTPSGGDFQSASNYAVKMAVMKNKFHRAADGTPEIAESDIKWYLPAKDEQSGITDGAYPLSGTYWSSTVTDNNSAYSYSGSSVSTTARTTACKIRAARKKP